MIPSAIVLSSFLALQAQAQNSGTTTISGSISGTITGGDVVPTSGVTYASYSRTSTITSSLLAADSSSSSGASNSDSSGNTASSSSSTARQTLSLLGGASTTLGPANGTSMSSSSTSSATPTNTQACNNYVEFCSRKYSNITEITAHNSPFVRPNNVASNQALPVLDQLNDGIRMIQGQTHSVNGTLHYCHTSCDLLDAGPVVDYLTTVAEWVRSHPFDVLTILIANGDLQPVDVFVDPIQASGLGPYLYVPPEIPMGLDDWPTLSQMILTSKRVVVFMDYNANQSAVPYILDQFSQMWETPFDPTNASFPCTVDRPPSLSRQDAQSRMYLMNHNLNLQISFAGQSLLVPNTALINTTNNGSEAGIGSLGSSAANCSSDWNRAPNFLLVDYYNEPNGTVFEVAAQMNNVTYNRQCCGLTPTGAASGLRLGLTVTYVTVAALAFALFL
ncbi:MAG: hypothetical protein M1820_004297 [Bogoriella megaspora]|nr:MAG: hypothetical protein M1820_004297 [Bogoriella megaspora]